MMRRRVTLHDLSKLDGRVPKGRSMSMGNLANHDAMNLGHGRSERHSAGTRGESSGSSTSKKRTSNRSSPTSSTTNQPPPTTRLRTRKVSATSSVPNTTPTSASSKSCKGKGKSKQVEFSRDVVDQPKSPPSKRRLRERAREREREARARLLEEESDLTDVEEVGQSIRAARVGTNLPQISPRRLRSKDKEAGKGKGKVSGVNTVKERRNRKSVDIEETVDDAGDRRKRVAPVRKTNPEIQSLKEEDNSDEQEGEDEDDEDELSDEEEMEEEEEEAQEEEEGEEHTDEDPQEEEVDELVSSASATPPMSQCRRTPLRKRLRPRTRNGSAAPDDGDIEDEGEEDEEGAKETEEAGESGEETESGEEVENGEEDPEGEEDAEGSEDEATIAVEPRKLRSGKVVGDEEDVEMETVEEDIGEEDSETGEEEEAEELEIASEIDVDAEGETDEDEIMEEEVDLTIATAKTLVRLRRDDLIRLCETRDLEPVGTKPQLAEALLHWRDRQAHSSPSSTGTVRPPSTRKRGRKKATSSATTATTTTPVLLRPEHLHDDEPRTPVPDQEKEAEQELELDLESLGLEDREIPPEKLTKLEKIGSGGFKDVFIGKFKGRRVAISEFRGTLSTSELFACLARMRSLNTLA
ncbi:hypothetical protein P691DRAFT_87251 [Macrolepiota fuliginosa MF-IS2]|uniref:Uncharacterized protein n=1 Tax=Macrolepiota fuliginosa MF-IS2 TaxID=1400762 RepID=A0A9P5XE46_9AGAR|nr:hypothetical protein P691DRAFT_87251 [Macrolepiota fuliginosa MF-IS2]